LYLRLVLPKGAWVPHISLVFREMWDTTTLNRPGSHPTSNYIEVRPPLDLLRGEIPISST
jgi:hypothetical protein